MTGAPKAGRGSTASTKPPARPSAAKGTRARLDGTLFLAETCALYVGPLVATAHHAHHSAQIVVAPEGLAVEDGAGGRVQTRAAVIPPRRVHAHGACAFAAVLFLDGDDPVSQALACEAEARCETWSSDSLDVSVDLDSTPASARTLIAAILAAVEPRHRPKAQHPAARRMRASLGRSDHADLASLSREAGLSPRQMRHAFARDVGLPLRAYLRWKRLRRAIDAVAAGENLSTAAVSAGFADSAHLSRVFREQFGLTPTQGLTSVRWRTLD